ncbi:hydroxysqualene dehydroxylase HpnE [Jatrophihabitans sp. DSM 45814]
MTGGVVVVGGGLAGITAALDLADAGRAVTLLETRPRLGGAASSFSRAFDGGELTVDNGQHIFLRCCHAYRQLIDRLDAAELVTTQAKLDIAVLRPDGRRSRLARTAGLPAPLHLSASLAGYGLLSIADRLRAVRGALAMRRLDPADPSLDVQTFGRYLADLGQTTEIINNLWGVLATATLNIDPADASLALAAKVFRTGLLDHADAADVGHAVVPLGAIHHDAAWKALVDAGVDVRLSARVLEVDSPAASGPVVQVRERASDPEGASVAVLRPEAVILALPHAPMRSVAPALAAGSLGRTEALGASPIVNVHVVYDRQVTDLPLAAAVGSPVQWVFDRTSSSGLSDLELSSGPSHGAQYLAVTVSAADAIIGTPAAELRSTYIDALAQLFPAARSAEVLDSFVTREPRATFRQAAGTAELRPSPKTELEGVYLAGSWTATGWPDTMESAVLSGKAAASRILEGSGTRGRS